MYSVVFVFSILVLSAVDATQPTAVNSTITVKDFQLLGVDLSLATFSFTFDQDLYLHQSNYCPPYDCVNDTVTRIDQNSCVCDYSNQTTCGSGYLLSNPSTPCVCNFTDSPCDTNIHNWTSISLATVGEIQTFTTTIKQGETRHWRLFVNGGCRGFHFYVNSAYGTSNFFVSNKGVATSVNSVWSSTNQYQKESAYICPTDYHFIQGTYFIAVEGLTDTQFDLVVEEIMVAPVNVSQPALCNNASLSAYPWMSTSRCLANGVPQSFSSASKPQPAAGFYFNITFTESTCVPVFIALDDYASGSVTTAFSINFVSEGNATKYSGNFRESFIICQQNSEPWTALRIRVTTQTLAYPYSYNFRLAVTTGYFNHWTHTALDSIPIYETNFDLLGTSKVDTYPYGVSITFDAAGNSARTYAASCTNWRTDCRFISFTTSENPLWPVPPIVLNLPGVGDLFSTVKGNYSIPAARLSSKTYAVVLVLSYETNSYVENVPVWDVESLIVEFRGKIGNLAGEPIVGNYTASVVPGHCSNSEFGESLDAIQDVLKDLEGASDIEEINALRYKLDSYSFQDAFAFCRQFVDNLTLGVTTQNFTVSSFYCQRPTGTFAWYSDPCCSQNAGWIATCFPSNKTGPLPQFEVQADKVNAVCKNVQCSQSYLEDYASAKAFDAGQCSVDLTHAKLLKEKVQKQYVQCKDEAFKLADMKCLQDTDCQYNNDTYPCHLYTGTCMVPYRVMEQNLITCLTDTLTEQQEVFLASKYNMSDNYSANFVQDWLNGVSGNDCLQPYGNSPNLEYRSKVVHSPIEKDCANLYSCKSYECEDEYCQYPDVTCNTACGLDKSFSVGSEVLCKEQYECNWDSDACDSVDTKAECDVACQSGNSFCGFCDSPDNCIQFTELTTPAQCASTSVCILSNGTYLFNLTTSQCDAMTKCDLPYCGRQCAAVNQTYSAGICFSYEANNVACTTKGGNWLNNSGGGFSSNPNICVFNANSNSACNLITGATWQTCSSLSLYDCANCSGNSCPNITQNLMKCHIAGKPCTDQPTCTGSGICSDSTPFLDMTSTPQRYGGCVMPRFPAPDVDSFRYCLPGQTSIPVNCMWNPSQSREKSSCATLGQISIYYPSTWTYPSEDEATCLSRKGCLDLFYDQQRYSPKDQVNCTSEYAADEWTNLWEWRQGRWVGGVQRSLSWTQRQAYPKYEWNTTIDYQQLQADYFDSALQTVALESKSAGLCQYQRTLDPMQAVTCDCTDSDSSQCFSVDPVSAIAQTQACAETSSVGRYSGVQLTFTNDSVSLGCTELVISKISIREYKSQPEERLLANFIPLTQKDVPDYPVYNKKNAVVGRILTDGVTITPLASGTLESFQLCIQLTAVQKTYEPSSEYPQLGFASGTANKDGDKVVPLKYKVTQIKILENTIFDGQYLCATIYNLTSESSYFAIEHKTNYENEDKEVLSPTSEALSYTLAAMFLLAALISSGQLLNGAYSYLFKHLPLVLEQFLVLFIWLFVTVRTVYFFLITQGVESQVADYVLVALPTFFYFTAFSIIVVLWAVVASKRFTNDVNAFKKTINRLLIGINVLLYAVFVVLVLAFQFAKSTTESPCSGRQESDDNSSELKRNISIAYGLLIASISLIIGVLFVVFGFRIRTFITASQSQGKIFVVTLICSVGFILHSVFIVVVSFLTTPNLYFSFVGLIVTEWFPALFIISWTFIQRTSMRSSTSLDKKSMSITRGGTPSKSVSKISSRSRTDTNSAIQVELNSLDVDN